MNEVNDRRSLIDSAESTKRFQTLQENRFRTINIPESIQFLNDVIEDETYASAFSLGHLNFNSGNHQQVIFAGSTELKENFVMSTGQIELPDFDELETFRLKQSDAKNSLEMLLGKTKKRVPLLQYETQRMFSFSKLPDKNLNQD